MHVFCGPQTISHLHFYPAIRRYLHNTRRSQPSFDEISHLGFWPQLATSGDYRPWNNVRKCDRFDFINFYSKASVP
uniref:Uncharacterized protein n=1 Tax=Trichuris muris TaxID=70415 RepID=A0A5S6R1G4_TRIMR